jgi:hypothetical protein
MKYFTPDWWAGDVEDIKAPIEAYQRYLDAIRPFLTPAMATLQDEVSLHDSHLRDLLVNVPQCLLTLVLDGDADPWTPANSALRRFTMHYHGLRSMRINSNDEPTFPVHGDLGYQEIERLNDGMFEHRLLFSNGTEIVIQFADLQLQYVDLKEPVV